MDTVVLFFRALLLLTFFRVTGVLRCAYEALRSWSTAVRFWFHCGVIRRVVRRGRLVVARNLDPHHLCLYDCLLDGKVFKTVSRGGDPDISVHVKKRDAVRAAVMAVVVHAAPDQELADRDLGAVSSFVQERACGFEESNATVLEVLRLAEAACGLQQWSLENKVTVVNADFSHADFTYGDVIRL